MAVQKTKLVGAFALAMLFLGALSETASARWPYRGGGYGYGYGARYGAAVPGIGYGVTRYYSPGFGGYSSYYPRSYGTTIYRGGYFGTPYYGNRYYGNSFYGSPYSGLYSNRIYGGYGSGYYRGF